MKIKSWEDVDGALAEIAKRREAIAIAKARADTEREAIAELEPRIEAFVREHEDELQERSKSLPHGRVWLRSATRLVARSWAKVLERLQEGNMWGCIRKKYEVDKEALEERTDSDLAEVGARRKTEDVFGYEVA